MNANNASASHIRSSQSGGRQPITHSQPRFNVEEQFDDDRRSVGNDRASVVSVNLAPRQQGQNTRYHSLQIHKWNWQFSADKSSKIPEEKDLRAFFKKLEIYREAEQMTYEQIFTRFHLLVKGSASDWYIQ